MTPAYIIDAVRTPRGIGKAGKGALADMHPQHLAASTLKAIAERNTLNTADVDDIIWSTTCGKSTKPLPSWLKSSFVTSSSIAPRSMSGRTRTHGWALWSRDDVCSQRNGTCDHH
jgi:hypothetical protein